MMDLNNIIEALAAQQLQKLYSPENVKVLKGVKLPSFEFLDKLPDYLQQLHKHIFQEKDKPINLKQHMKLEPRITTMPVCNK